MRLHRELKRRARKALRGRRAAAAALLLLWLFTWLMVDLGDRAAFYLLSRRLSPPDGALPPLHPAALTATAAALALRLVLLIPLWAGAVTWFDGLTARRPRPVTTLFWPYGNRVWLRSLGVRLYAWMVTGAVALLPLGALGAALWLLRELLMALTPEGRALAAALAGVGAAAWLMTALAYGKRFAMAGLLLGPDYGCTAREAVALSARCTWGHRWRMVWMDLTFLPWGAACLLVLPAFYVLPYYAACRVGYGQYLYRRWRRRNGSRQNKTERT